MGEVLATFQLCVEFDCCLSGLALGEVRMGVVVHTRFAAMDALATVSGGELSTLREEEWATWFNQTADELEQRIRALEAAADEGRS